jgi:glyoxylase-like metal-dependent hydrolase (beta-lactamase superfamily II)
MLTQPSIDRPAIARRAFLADLGRGAFAIAIVGLAGCSPSTLATFTPGPAATPAGSSPEPGTASPTTDPGAPGSSSPPASAGGGGVAWARVNLGFVSAYLLVRGGEAALVDTGVGGSAGAIGDSLSDIGLGWDAVGHVVLTHHHGDHQGSLGEVIQLAPTAIAYAGAEDVPSITGAPSVTAVGDGDTVFGLQVVTTPGHTAGSICVLDPVAGVLVAGDALRVEGGKPTLPGAQFTADMDEAKRSVVKLGGWPSRRSCRATATRSSPVRRRSSRSSAPRADRRRVSTPPRLLSTPPRLPAGGRWCGSSGGRGARRSRIARPVARARRSPGHRS